MRDIDAFSRLPWDLCEIDLLFYVLFLFRSIVFRSTWYLSITYYLLESDDVWLVPNPLRNWRDDVRIAIWRSFQLRFSFPRDYVCTTKRDPSKLSRGECCFLTQLLRPKVARKPAEAVVARSKGSFAKQGLTWGRLITEILSLFCWPHCIDFSTTVTMTVG